MTAIRRDIRFLLNDDEIRLEAVGPNDTLLDHIRLARRLTGTKEGCAEGDCGACTVLIGRLTEKGLRYEPVNACIRLLASVDRCHVVTVERLAGPHGLHPVQQAMVAEHASQCGFCTPGIVMSLYALWLSVPEPGEAEIETALQGNLCRCTGYQPIVDAARAACALGNPAEDFLVTGREAIAAKLTSFDGARVEVEKDGARAFLPADLEDFAELRADMPEATIVAGATDVGLWVTKEMRDISPAIFVGHLTELKEIAEDEAGLTLGAAVTYSEAAASIRRMFPHLSEFWPRIGGWQVRNMGTVGGNIANGSPIGDTPPVLIALGARVILRHREERRILELEDFFLDYGRQDRKPGDFLEAIHIPRPAPDTLNAAYKISKRRDEDISAVCGAFALRLDGDTVASVRIAFGGMAATPKRARGVEAALQGKPWTEETVAAAASAFAGDFSPIGDWRASADYRALIARNLLLRFFYETSDIGEPVRLSAMPVPEAAGWT
ncbi:xanthine dehydrogenase small subunit [Rhodobium orientis]|uniref:Xanthine dehydrogenase small subunit n=1 Tax=Rhodobium orientis TaxID=34017 RepID=A0A327JHR2_9HYPH|nr:xanthine dehydrogenase small subunit [Rhodobium orientis]MBB4301871.1 xanthine dehydrogenase small subunit [Rhodobium orientis]MBK5950109.1 xanthine dehydrogenase small subunit [Rhodobium orientis]RAI25665.1 xanthine dehydrogenase small subunit [Rhodobium orientis]